MSPYQYIAADVKQDGRVSAADALSILKMAVNLSGAPAREWIMLDESTDLYDETSGTFTVNRSNIDWVTIKQEAATIDVSDNRVAVLKSDVNASWQADASATVLDENYFARLETDNIGPSEQWWVV